MPEKKASKCGCGSAAGGGKKKSTAASKKKKSSGGGAEKPMEPVVGRGASPKITTAGMPVKNSGAVWNRVAMYPSNLAHQEFHGSGVINRGLVTPNKPHHMDLVTFGGGGKKKKKK
jgi:hypothetical protein